MLSFRRRCSSVKEKSISFPPNHLALARDDRAGRGLLLSPLAGRGGVRGRAASPSRAERPPSPRPSPPNRNRLLPISTLLKVPKSGKPDFGGGRGSRPRQAAIPRSQNTAHNPNM